MYTLSTFEAVLEYETQKRTYDVRSQLRMFDKISNPNFFRINIRKVTNKKVGRIVYKSYVTIMNSKCPLPKITIHHFQQQFNLSTERFP